MGRTPSPQELHELAEKLAVVDEAHRRHQRRWLAVILVAAALAVAGIAAMVAEVQRTVPPPVAIDPAKLPPIRPGPPR